MNPVHLQTLVTVLRTGSFADAARDLGYTSSAVSQQIAALERSLKVTLFDRSARSITPTPAATLVADRCRDSLAALSVLEDDVAAVSSGRVGTLRIGSFPTASERILPTAFRHYIDASPEVSIRLDEAEPCELLLRLQEGSLDVALEFRYRLVPKCTVSGTRTITLLEEDLVLLVPAEHPAAQSADPTWDDFREATWIATRDGTDGAECLERLCAQAGYTPRIAFRTNDYDTVREFVSCGLGVALVPAMTLMGVGDSEQFRIVSLPGTEAMRSIHVLHRSEILNPVVPGFLDALRQAADELSGDRVHVPQ
nr:LysR family transcriptional regulator [Yimella sp. cx-51]